MLRARHVIGNAHASHIVTWQTTPSGTPYVRIAVQPNFTGIDEQDANADSYTSGKRQTEFEVALQLTEDPSTGIQVRRC